jgi:hypothetical protein
MELRGFVVKRRKTEPDSSGFPPKAYSARRLRRVGKDRGFVPFTIGFVMSAAFTRLLPARLAGAR